MNPPPERRPKPRTFTECVREMARLEEAGELNVDSWLALFLLAIDAGPEEDIEPLLVMLEPEWRAELEAREVMSPRRPPKPYDEKRLRLALPLAGRGSQPC